MSATSPPRRLTMSGMTMSLEIMIDSATVSTITMAVAAESAPAKAASVTASAPASIGSASTKVSASAELPKRSMPAAAIGTTKMLMSSR